MPTIVSDVLLKTIPFHSIPCILFQNPFQSEHVHRTEEDIYLYICVCISNNISESMLTFPKYNKPWQKKEAEG